MTPGILALAGLLFALDAGPVLTWAAGSPLTWALTGAWLLSSLSGAAVDP